MLGFQPSLIDAILPGSDASGSVGAHPPDSVPSKAHTVGMDPGGLKADLSGSHISHSVYIYVYSSEDRVKQTKQTETDGREKNQMN